MTLRPGTRKGEDSGEGAHRPWARRVATGVELASMAGAVGDEWSAWRPGGRCVGGLGESGGVGMDAVERRVETRGDWRNFAVNVSGDLWLPESKEWVLEDVF